MTTTYDHNGHPILAEASAANRRELARRDAEDALHAVPLGELPAVLRRVVLALCGEDAEMAGALLRAAAD